MKDAAKDFVQDREKDAAYYQAKGEEKLGVDKDELKEGAAGLRGDVKQRAQHAGDAVKDAAGEAGDAAKRFAGKVQAQGEDALKK